MPESRGWAGQAHGAAVGMFGRATDRSSAFKNYAEAFADALGSGSSANGRVVGLMPHPEHATEALTGPSDDGLGIFFSALDAVLAA